MAPFWSGSCLFRMCSCCSMYSSMSFGARLQSRLTRLLRLSTYDCDVEESVLCAGMRGVVLPLAHRFVRCAAKAVTYVSLRRSVAHTQLSGGMSGWPPCALWRVCRRVVVKGAVSGVVGEARTSRHL